LRAVPSRRTPLQLPVSCGRTRSGAMQINRNTPAVAHRQAGALLRRYAVQCRRRELPQRRPSGGTVQDVRRAACQAAIIDLDLPRATTTSKTICVSRWIASPTTRRRARCSTSSPGRTPTRRTYRRWKSKVRSIRSFASAADGHREVARVLPRPARQARPAHGVHEAARTAQLVVKPSD
jgi:hypothetical protein